MLKTFLRKSEKPLQQVIRRYTERRRNDYDESRHKSQSLETFKVDLKHNAGLLAEEITDIVHSQYR